VQQPVFSWCCHLLKYAVLPLTTRTWRLTLEIRRVLQKLLFSLAESEIPIQFLTGMQKSILLVNINAVQ